MEKAQLRAEMARIGPVSPETNEAVVSALFSFLSPRLPGTIAAYLSMPSEVDLESLVERLPGWRWVLPRVETDRSLTFRNQRAGWIRCPYIVRYPCATSVFATIRSRASMF